VTLAANPIRAALVVLGVVALAAGCRGEEKGKAPAPAAAPRPKEKPREAAAQKARPKAEAKARAEDKDKERVVKKVATARGPLLILRRGEPPEYWVMLGEERLVKPKERVIEVASVHTSKAKTKFVLLRFPSKDKDCPALFRVVEVPKGKDPLRTSDEFGNCNPRPRAHAVAAGWKVTFPKTKKEPAKTWVYADGDVREVEAKKG
jgi:hypothetical protein